jgi:hypothetical protein
VGVVENIDSNPNSGGFYFGGMFATLLYSVSLPTLSCDFFLNKKKEQV